jgi:hypothetical protein
MHAKQTTTRSVTVVGSATRYAFTVLPELKRSNWHTDLEFVRIQIYPDDPLGSSHPGPLRYLQFIGSGIAVMNSRHAVQCMIHPGQRMDHHATDYIVRIYEIQNEHVWCVVPNFYVNNNSIFVC